MSSGSPLDAKEQVREATDIVELIGQQLTLRRQGRIFVTHCPWHDDQKPSLQVNPERQSWKCWVCDIGGDVFSFVMRREGLSFRETLQLLAERAGITLRAAPRTTPGSPNDRQTLFAALRWAEQQYHECFLQAQEAEPARRYVLERGLTLETAKRFHLGYSPKQRRWLLERAKSAGFSPEVLQAVDLLQRFDDGGMQDRFGGRFGGRLMFPIRDVQSRALGFGARVLPGDDLAKYINSRETKLFTKSEQVYALDLAREAAGKKRAIVVVEGYTDVIAAHQAGVENVVAVLGTALGSRHIRLLRRYADTIYLVLDGDDAGRRRAGEVLNQFVAEDVDLRVATLPDQQDPCDFLLQFGGDAFEAQLQAAPDALEYRAQRALDGIDLDADPHHAHRALEEILQTLAGAPRVQTDSAKRLRQQQMLNRLARIFRIRESALRDRLRDLRKSRPADESLPPEAIDEEPRTRYRISDLHADEQDLLEILIAAPELVATATEKVSVKDLNTALGKGLYAAFLRVQQAGRTPDFGGVLTELEDPDLKDVLVTLDDIAGKKTVHSEMDAATRLQEWSKRQELKQVEQLRQRSTQAIESGNHAESDADLLRRHFELLQQLKRNGQGFSDPTDG